LQQNLLGNTDKFLHAHIFPRYNWESEERKKMPVWLYDQSNWFDKETAYNSEKHDSMKNAILKYLDKSY